jgi:hypothetical protein
MMPKVIRSENVKATKIVKKIKGLDNKLQNFRNKHQSHPRNQRLGDKHTKPKPT